MYVLIQVCWFLVCFRVECVGVGKGVVLENSDV